MNADDIVIMQNVAKSSDRTHMLKFLEEHNSSFRASMDELDREERQNEDYELEELIALNR